MCLVAQFGKWLFRIFFFSGPTFLTSTSDKKVIVAFRAFLKNNHFLLHAEILSQIFKELP